MTRTLARLFVPLLLLGISQLSSAQALVYVDCAVEDVPSLQAAISRFYDSMEGGPRPIVFLDQWIWNGEDPSTHRIILGYPDYAALEAFRARVATGTAGLLAFNAVEAVADCTTEGLSVLRGVWGNQEVQTPYFAVFGISARDPAAYAAALTELAESQVGAAPGSTILFENRAGISTDTHIVVIGAPTLAGLNEYLDQLFASDEFAEFEDEVRDSRTVTWRRQVFRMRAWTPGPPPGSN